MNLRDPAASRVEIPGWRYRANQLRDFAEHASTLANAASANGSTPKRKSEVRRDGPQEVMARAHGVGGGQIVRSSLALALVTGKSVTIENIRAGREKPGLMPQHLTVVQAAASVRGGIVKGAEIGSQSLIFEPRPVCPEQYRRAAPATYSRHRACNR
jgi:hypothetical protein